MNIDIYNLKVANGFIAFKKIVERKRSVSLTLGPVLSKLCYLVLFFNKLF